MDGDQNKMASKNKRRRHSEDSIQAFSSLNHVDRIRTKDIYTKYPRDYEQTRQKYIKYNQKSLSNLDIPYSVKYPESLISNTTTGHRSRDLEADLYEKLSLKRGYSKPYIDHSEYPTKYEQPREFETYSERNSNSLYDEEDRYLRNRSLDYNEEPIYSTRENIYRNRVNESRNSSRNRINECQDSHVGVYEDTLTGGVRNRTPDAEFNDQSNNRISEACSLRRTRSLAVIREETFTDLQVSNNNRTRRSQLIPRARLIDKSGFKERFRHKFKEDSTGSIYNQSICSGQSDKNSELSGTNPLSLPKSDCIQIPSKKRDAKSIVSSWPHYTDSLPYILGTHGRERDDVDSLDSNYFKHSNYDTNTCSLENAFSDDLKYQEEVSTVSEVTKPLFILSDNYEAADNANESENSNDSSEGALKLPNYINDSKYDTDLSLTHDTVSLENREKPKSITNYDLLDQSSEEENKLEDTVTTTRDFNSLTITKTDRGKIISDLPNIVSEDNTEVKEEKISIGSYDSIYSSENCEKYLNDKKPLHGDLITIKIEDYDEIKSENISYIEIPLSSDINDSERKSEDLDSIYSQVKKNKPKVIYAEPKSNGEESNLSSFVSTEASEITITETYSEKPLARTNSQECFENKSTNKIDVNFKHRGPGYDLIPQDPYVLENQYFSLPDENIGKCLRKCERIDATLRRIDNDEKDSIYDSISRFGRAHKRLRQRESCEVVNLNPISIEEQPKEVQSIEIEPVTVLETGPDSVESLYDTPKINDDNFKTYNKPNTVSISGRKVIVDDSVNDQEYKSDDDNYFENKFNAIRASIYKSLERDEIKIFKNDFVSTKPPVIGCNNIKKLPPALMPKFGDNNKTFGTNKPKYLENSAVFNQYKKEVEQVDYNWYKAELKPVRSEIETKKKEITTDVTFKNYTKMSRPQILNIIDSKERERSQNNFISNSSTEINKIKLDSESNEGLSQGTVTDNGKENGLLSKKQHTEKNEIQENDKCVQISKQFTPEIEYQEKIDSVRCYWSKLIDSKGDKISNDTELYDDSGNVIQNHVTSVEDSKPIEPVKIVDSLKKYDTNISSMNVWKREEKNNKEDKDKDTEKSNENYLSFCPSIEIIDLENNQATKLDNKHTAVIKTKSFEDDNTEFDHIRYKVVKSDVFQKNIFGNYKKEAQFDGLMQYLQDYSFQELLINNNVVIIEPVRTKIETTSAVNSNNKSSCRITAAMEKKKPADDQKLINATKNNLKRHFFYHPIRVNRELIDEELPNPDTVRNVRKLFEKSKTQDSEKSVSTKNLTDDSKSKITPRKKILRYLTIDTSFGHKKWDSVSLSSGVSSDLSSAYDYECDGLSPGSKSRENCDNMYMSSSEENICESFNTELCCDTHYVSEDVLEKIRECGTSITYYGGKVVGKKREPMLSPMTKAIMEEIRGLQKSCSKDCESCKTKCKGKECVCTKICVKYGDKLQKNGVDAVDSNSKRGGDGVYKAIHHVDKKNKENYSGIKFRLVKSNSCSSRLELVGTGKSKYKPFRGEERNKNDKTNTVNNEIEESVKSKINRLESIKTEPRIILSKCIEKKQNPDVKLDPFTINNQSTFPEKVNKLDKTNILSNGENSVTVNNHITLAATNLEIEKEKNTEGKIKISRNKNVDLAFETLTKNKNTAIELKKPSMNINEPKLVKWGNIASLNKTEKMEKEELTKLDNKYYNNTKIINRKPKYDEMEFEEFEVLECYDSLNQ